MLILVLEGDVVRWSSKESRFGHHMAFVRRTDSLDSSHGLLELIKLSDILTLEVRKVGRQADI